MPIRPARGTCELTDTVPDERDAAHPDRVLAAAEARDEEGHVEGAITRALAQLTPEDRRTFRMLFRDGMTVADIARALRLPQMRLYRRLGRALHGTRRA